MVGGDTVFKAARSAGILSHIAAQGGHLLAGGIRCVKKTQRGQGVLKLQIGHSGLQHSATPSGCNIEDAV